MWIVLVGKVFVLGWSSPQPSCFCELFAGQNLGIPRELRKACERMT